MDIMYLVGGFAGGFFTGVAGLYAYAKSQGVFSAMESLENVKKDYNRLESEVRTAIGNISLTEVGVIMKRGAELGKDGYNMKDAEILGVMIIDAMKQK
jgi:hypothetical protein